MLATATFSITGVLAASEKRVDVFGVLVLGIVTAVGGGTVRDAILGIPAFWVDDFHYVWMAGAAALFAFALRRVVTKAFRVLLYLDAFGAALFAITGMDRGMDLGASLPVVVVLGVATAIGGGLLRDVLAGRPTLLMSREVYATPILFGCALYALAASAFPRTSWLAVAAMAVIFALRAASIRFDLRMPEVLVMQIRPPQQRDK